MSERFIKLKDEVYYESTLRLMNNEQLKELITKCQNGIKEINFRLEDYKNTNYENMDMEHYNVVVHNFESAMVYLQSDIVLLEKIIKEKGADGDEKDISEWYKSFFSIASASLFKPTLNKLIKATDALVGFEMEVK